MTDEVQLPSKPVPAVLWHGSKWRLAPKIIPYFPPHFTYVEPYGGSAAVLLHKAPSGAEVYNDINRELNNFFTVLRTQPVELAAAVDLTPFGREEYELSWAGRDSQDATPLERARRFVTCCYLSRGSIIDRSSPTGWRMFAKRSDFGSTPMEVWQKVPDRLMWVAQRLKKAALENKPALEVIRRQDSADTLFYCDPPYPAESRHDKQQNYAHDMTLEEHEELLHALMRVKGAVALSSYGHWMYREMLTGWKEVRLMTRVQSNESREEVLWLNPKCWQNSPRFTDNTGQVVMDFGASAAPATPAADEDEAGQMEAAAGAKVALARRKA